MKVRLNTADGVRDVGEIVSSQGNSEQKSSAISCTWGLTGERNESLGVEMYWFSGRKGSSNFLPSQKILAEAQERLPPRA